MMKTKLLLLVIVIAAGLLRLWNLGSYPALNADEAAIGYNAFSLITTGKDEHGNFWPIHFQSFNDFKPGLYFYLVMPFVKALGLNEWAVRIPGALLGVATVIVVYFLIKELFNDKKFALITSFFLAISPWHIHFSRGGWEVSVATLFITLGLLLFLKALKAPQYFFFSFLTFVLALYTYHAARILVPILGLALLIIYRQQILSNLKQFIIAGAVSLVLLLPLAKDLAGAAGISRAAGVGLFADSGPVARINEERGEHGDYQSLPSKILHNKAVNYGLAFLQNWGEHYWGEFLFSSGEDIQRNKVPETGQMYLLDLVFILAGLWGIARNTKGWKAILVWLFIAPIPAALTFQSPHALRAQNMVIPLTIISAYGFLSLYSLLKGKFHNKYWATSVLIILVALITWNFARYLHMYYKHMAKEYPFSSQYGVKELVGFVGEKEGEFQKVIVTTRYDQPYILFLFYMKYPPQKFQMEHALSSRDKYGFSTVNSFGKYYFEPIVYDRTQVKNPGSLIVGTPEEIPGEANIVKKIFGTNGYLYFEAVAN